MRFRLIKTGLNPTVVFPVDSFKAVLLQFFFVCASVFSYVAFSLSFVPHLSFLWCIGRIVLRDCATVTKHNPPDAPYIVQYIAVT